MSRRYCRADELEMGTPISVGYAFGPVAGLTVTDQRVSARIEGDSLWHNWQPDAPVYLEPAEHLLTMLATRRP